MCPVVEGVAYRHATDNVTPAMVMNVRDYNRDSDSATVESHVHVTKVRQTETFMGRVL